MQFINWNIQRKWLNKLYTYLKSLKNYLILFLSFLIIGCAEIVTRPPITQYNPQKHARIRVILEREKGEQRQSYTNFKVVENGKYKEYGFKVFLLDGYVADKEIISLGMPNKPKLYKKYAEKSYREFIIPAESEVILPNTKSIYCDEAWFFKTCYEHVTSSKFVAHAGKDYEIINSYHVYEILNEQESKEIERNSESLGSRRIP